MGKTSFSLKRGFASINFLSSMSIMLRADLVSPYLDSCSFSLQTKNIIRKLVVSYDKKAPLDSKYVVTSQSDKSVNLDKYSMDN